MQNGSMVEIATVGDEGVVGINALFGDGTIVGETMMQVPDTSAEVMSVEALPRRTRSQGRILRKRPALFAGLPLVDDAVGGVPGAASRSCPVLPLAADDARSRASAISFTSATNFSR